MIREKKRISFISYKHHIHFSLNQNMILTMPLLLLVSSFSIILLFTIVLSKLKDPKKTSRLPPGPKGLPLIGNLHEFDVVYPNLYLYKLAQKYGPLMSMKFGTITAIVVSSARVAKLALKTNDLALSGRPQRISHQMLSYNGLDITFSPYNERWREMRKISLLQLFSIKQVVSFRPVRKDEVSRMIKDMNTKASSGEVINLSRAVFFLTSSIICRVGFGKKYDETGKRRFDQLLKEAQEMGVAFFVGDYFPSLGWIDKLSGMTSRLKKNCKKLDDFYQELINDHLDPNRPESMNGDILDLLIKLREEQAAAVHIDWDNIKAVLMNIFIAGTDTSASVITWAMTALMRTPKAMKKAQDEVRAFVGNKGSVDEDDVQNLPYLKAVIKETMRLFPPTPLSVPRETIEKCTIDGYEIPPKTLVFVNVYAIGRDPEYWDNPTEFFPDRFLNSTIDYRGHDFGLLPFGSGRRGCPGINLGLATVELALANLLYSFDWELPNGMKPDSIDMDVLPGITSIKKDDLCLVGKRYV